MNLLLWADDASAPGLDAVLTSLAEMGFDGIEVPVFSTDPAPYEAIGAKIRELGMEPLALTARPPGANPISADPTVRARGIEENRLAVEAAAAMGATMLCGPMLAAPGEFSGAPPTDDERAWAAQALRSVAEAADPHGMTVAIESLSHFEHYLANTTRETAALVRRADHPRARMMYDTFHAHIEEKDVRAAITDCADVLAYVHVSENDRSTPGSGQVNWDATFETLHDIAYDGWLTVEAFGDVHPRLAPQMKIWRRAYDSEHVLAREALAFVREAWPRAAGGNGAPAAPSRRSPPGAARAAF